MTEKISVRVYYECWLHRLAFRIGSSLLAWAERSRIEAQRAREMKASPERLLARAEAEERRERAITQRHLEARPF